MTAGEGFEDRGGGAYAIAAARPEDYDSLLAALAEGGGLPTRIVHCWSVTGEGAEAGGASPGGEVRQRGFESLFYLAQALGRQRVEAATALGVVSDGIHRITGQEHLCPEKALVLGPCKVIAQEYPFLSCRSIDVELPGEPRGRAELLESLIGEMACDGSEQVIAYRGGRRHVQGFEPVHLDREAETRAPLRPRGTYLITGGLGGIGLVLAEHLARTVNARLVLIGRSAMPEREEWEEWLSTHGADDVASQRIAEVQAIERSGGEVLVIQADVADAEQMRSEVERARRHFGPLNGVIHAAGVPGGGIIQTKRMEVAAGVLKPKVEGTYALAAAVAGEPLDFLILCSSTIAVLGNFGQVDYCAANNFLDAFASHHAAVSGVPTLSINWGAWKEVGMAAATTMPTGVLELQRAVTSAAAPASPGEPIHPLVETLRSASEEGRVYSTDLSVACHWVLDEHRVLGAATLPGTSYLEMARAAYADATGSSSAELRQVFFLAPLMVAETESREVRIVLEKAENGFKFQIVSRSAGAGEGSSWQEHVRGEVGAAEGSLPSSDLAALQRRCDGEERVIEEEMLSDRDGLVYWGARWQSLEKVRLGEGEALALLSLPEEFVGDLSLMPLHPALVDVATAVISLLREDSYLPLSYQRLRLSGALPRKFYSHIRLGDGGGGETLRADVTLIGEDGAGLVEIEGFTMKRVGAAVDRLQDSATSTAQIAGTPAAGRQPAERSFLAEGGMLSSEGVEVFRRILSRWPGTQVVVSPRDLGALLAQSAKARAQGVLGDLDKLTRRAAHPRPSVKSEFVEPESEAEKALATVWQDVLGIDRVGAHDNFYELGGDSVLGIQILARARDAGIELTSDQLFQHQTIAELAREMGGSEGGEAVPDEPPATVGPFALTGLEPEVLERLTAGREIEDAYPLSPLQQGLLLEIISRPGAGLYCEQVSFTLEQEIDRQVMGRAWQLVGERYPILRTSFLWEDLEQPLQVVHGAAEIPIRWEDWCGLDAAEQEVRFRELAVTERDRGFDVSRAPLLRVTIGRLADARHRLLISYSHLLLDGWSAGGLVPGQVSLAYAALASGREPDFGPSRPYRDYIAWLSQQDRSAKEFWRDYLAGFTAPDELEGVRPASGAAHGHHFDERELILAADASAALQDFVREQRLTLNVAAQAAWALVLGHLGGGDDVVFGMNLSGRPAELADVDRMVGLFVNMLPARVRIPGEQEVLPWLQEIRARQSELHRHQYSLLSEVQAWSEVPHGRPLFETLYNFANYPSPWMGTEGKHLGFRYDSRNPYPLHLTVVPGDRVVLRLLHDRTRVEPTVADRILQALEGLLAALPAAAQGTVAGLRARLEGEDRQRRLGAGRKASTLARDKLKKRARGRRKPLAPAG